MRGSGVDQRRGPRRRLASERERRAAAIEVLSERFFKQRRGRRDRAGQECCVPVDHRALGVMQRVGWNGLRAEA